MHALENYLLGTCQSISVHSGVPSVSLLSFSVLLNAFHLLCHHQQTQGEYHTYNDIRQLIQHVMNEEEARRNQSTMQFSRSSATNTTPPYSPYLSLHEESMEIYTILLFETVSVVEITELLHSSSSNTHIDVSSSSNSPCFYTIRKELVGNDTLFVQTMMSILVGYMDRITAEDGNGVGSSGGGLHPVVRSMDEQVREYLGRSRGNQGGEMMEEQRSVVHQQQHHQQHHHHFLPHPPPPPSSSSPSLSPSFYHQFHQHHADTHRPPSAQSYTTQQGHEMRNFRQEEEQPHGRLLHRSDFDRHRTVSYSNNSHSATHNQYNLHNPQYISETPPQNNQYNLNRGNNNQYGENSYHHHSNIHRSHHQQHYPTHPTITAAAVPANRYRANNGGPSALYDTSYRQQSDSFSFPSQHSSHASRNMNMLPIEGGRFREGGVGNNGTGVYGGGGVAVGGFVPASATGGVRIIPKSHGSHVHPILFKFLLQIRSYNMDVLFPQQSHDKILVCIFAAIQYFGRPIIHRELIHLSMVLKESGLLSGVDNVSKTKIRGVLAILKQGELLVKGGALGEAVQMQLEEGIDNFRELRDRHDRFLLGYMVENRIDVPEELKGEVIWRMKEDVKMKRLEMLERLIVDLEGAARVEVSRMGDLYREGMESGSVVEYQEQIVDGSWHGNGYGDLM